MNKRWYPIDYFIGTGIIFIFTWNPNFAHGYITGLDEGVHLSWISQILLGKIPYKEIYMLWGPFSEWLPIAFMKASGISLTSFRLFYNLSGLFTLLLGFFVLKQFLKTRLFSYAGAWLLAATKVSDFWLSRWGGTRLLFGLLAIYLVILYINKDKKYFLFLSGLSSGIALFNSQESGIFCIFTVIFTFFLFRKYLTGGTKALFQYLLGIGIVVLPVVLYFLLNGAFLEFIKINFIDAITVYPGELLQTKFNLSMLKAVYLAPNAYFTVRLYYFLLSFGIFLISFLYLLFCFMVKKIQKDEISLFLVIVFGVLFLSAATRQITGEQLPFCAPMIICAALFILEKMYVWIRKNGAHPILSPRFLGRNTEPRLQSGRMYKGVSFKAAFLTSVILISIYFLIKSGSFELIKGTAARYMSIKYTSKERFQHFIYAPSHPIEALARLTGSWQRLDIERAEGIWVPEQQGEIITKVVDFIKKNTSSDEPILVFPHEGQYLFLANRLSATRIIPLIYAAMKIDYQKEVIKDLEKAKPLYCIYVQDAQITPRTKGDLPNELLLSLIYEYIIKNYEVIRQYDRTFILAKKH